MPRQPYSEAVKSDGEERLYPSPFCKGRGLGSGLRILSSQEGNRGVENALIKGKEGRVDFRTTVRKDGMILAPYASFTIFLRNKVLPMIYLLHIRFGSLP